MMALAGKPLIRDFVYEIEHDIRPEELGGIRQIDERLGLLSNIADPQVVRALVGRTLQYLLTARQRRIPYISHAYRATLVRPLCDYLAFRRDPDLYRDCREIVYGVLQEKYGTTEVGFMMPPYFLAALRRAGDGRPGDILEVAAGLRFNSPQVREVREVMNSQYGDDGVLDMKRYDELKRLLPQHRDWFRKEYGLEPLGPGRPIWDYMKVTTTASFPYLALSCDAAGLVSLGRDIRRRLTKYHDDTSLGLVFRMARGVHGYLSFADDVRRIWRGYSIAGTRQAELLDLLAADVE